MELNYLDSAITHEKNVLLSHITKLLNKELEKLNA